MDDGPERHLVNRMIRAARLDRSLYAEVAVDTTATRQAMSVVVVAAVASFISAQIAPPDLSWLGIPAEAEGASPPVIVEFILTPVLAIIAWLAWSGVAWFVGARMIATDRQDVEFLDVARATGFAEAPGVLGIVTFIPTLGAVVQFGVWIWLLVAAFFAIRASMRLSVGQSIGTMAVSFAAFLIITFVIGVIVGLLTYGGS